MDWGDDLDVQAGIGTGWRTLSSDEWQYVFNTRASGSTVNGTSNARVTHATINTDGTGVNGMILFPDGVTIAGGEGCYWSSLAYDENNAWSVYFSNGYVAPGAHGLRYFGQSVRLVYDAN